MNDTRILTAEQVAAFKREGFVVVPAFFDLSQVAHVTWWTDEIMNWPERQGRHMVYYEDSLKRPRRRVVQRIENFAPYHEHHLVHGTETCSPLLARGSESEYRRSELDRWGVNRPEPTTKGLSNGFLAT